MNHSLDIRNTGIFQRVKNQVFWSIFETENGNTAKVRHVFFKTDNVCALKSLIWTTNTKI
jgi:hypothetical protein